MASSCHRIRLGARAMYVVESTFSQSGLHEIFGFVFTVLLTLGALSDVRARRISNALVLTILLVGIVFVLIFVGPGRGMVSALEGALVGLAIWTPIWALKKLGAGDVKFFAAASVWIGPALALKATLLSAVFGGALALLWLAIGVRSSRYKKPLGQLPHLAAVEDVEVDNVGTGEPKEVTMLPYGVAMAAGLTLTAWFPHLFY